MPGIRGLFDWKLCILVKYKTDYVVYKERFQKQYLFYEHYLHVFQVNIQSEHLHTGFQQKKREKKKIQDRLRGLQKAISKAIPFLRT